MEGDAVIGCLGCISVELLIQFIVLLLSAPWFFVIRRYIVHRINSLGYGGTILTVNSLDEIIELVE